MLIALGVALLLIQKPEVSKTNVVYLQGVGLILALIKPQLTLPLLVGLLWQNPRQFVRWLPIPIVAMLVSFWQFGLSWPLDWLNQAQSLPMHMYRQGATLLFPYTAPLFVLPFLMKGTDRQRQAALVVATFIPQTSIYSFV